MIGQTNGRAGPLILILAAIYAGTYLTGHLVAFNVISVLVGLVGLSMVDEVVSKYVLHSPALVYFLRSEDGILLYCGSTNDLWRRMNEHTSDTTEAWRDDIATVSVVRHCHSLKQARRCEERRIRALTTAAKKSICPPLNNDVWAVSERKSPGNPLWWRLYRAQSVVWYDCIFHRRQTDCGRRLVINRRPEATDDWDDWQPEPETVEATYGRNEPPNLTMLALGPAKPVMSEDCPRTNDPSLRSREDQAQRTRPGRPRKRTTQASTDGQRTATTRINNPTGTTTNGSTAADDAAAELERRREADRLRKRAERARAKQQPDDESRTA